MFCNKIPQRQLAPFLKPRFLWSTQAQYRHFKKIPLSHADLMDVNVSTSDSSLIFTVIQISIGPSILKVPKKPLGVICFWVIPPKCFLLRIFFSQKLLLIGVLAYNTKWFGACEWHFEPSFWQVYWFFISFDSRMTKNQIKETLCFLTASLSLSRTNKSILSQLQRSSINSIYYMCWL